ncbi:hypothetical protein VTK26DRAFT_920 [Humicola hyalothermophila]
MNEPKVQRQCWECKSRRLVCDFARPGCQKCKSRHLDCPGYDGTKPLKWLKPQQVRYKGRRRDIPVDSRPATIDSVVRVVPPPTEPDRELTNTLEAFEYYNLHICPDLAATGRGGVKSPYFLPLFAASVLPRSLVHSIVCTALCHRILQSRDAAPSHQTALTRKLQRHRGESLRALSADLGRPEQQTSDRTLASVLSLLLVEIQHCAASNWRHHSNAAANIIEMTGGLGNLVFSRPYLRPLARYYAIIEVMGCTTSPSVSIESARNQLELISLLPILYGNGLDSCVPCPPDLFAEIIHINHLRSRVPNVTTIPSEDKLARLTADKCTVALDILRRIRAFSPDDWAAAVTLTNPTTTQQNNTATASTSNPQTPDFRGWQQIARIYQSAIAIYCIASLVPDHVDPNSEASPPGSITPTPQPPPHLTVLTSARQTCRRILFTYLRKLATPVPQSTQLRKLVIWPLVVAGIEAGGGGGGGGDRSDGNGTGGDGDEDMRRFVADELKWMSAALGIASPLVAREFLERRVWERGWEKRRRSWEELFDKSYVFAV